MTGDMKILQWEMPDRPIRVIEGEMPESYIDEDAIYLADSSDDRLNAALGQEGVYLYDSGIMSVYVKRDSILAETLTEAAAAAAACADPKSAEVDLAEAVAEFAYQKANGSIYLSEQRHEAYLTEKTGLKLEDGIYEFEVDITFSYYEGGEIGYITAANTAGTYQLTRVLEEGDFGRNGNARIHVEIPVRDYEEPIIGVYTYGNGAMKINNISYTQVRGNIPAELGRENEYRELAETVGNLYAQKSIPIGYVDTDGSGQSGFPDFKQVNEWLPEKISRYFTGEQMKYVTDMGECFWIVEKMAGYEEAALPEGGQLVAESTHYFILGPE